MGHTVCARHPDNSQRGVAIAQVTRQANSRIHSNCVAGRAGWEFYTHVPEGLSSCLCVRQGYELCDLKVPHYPPPQTWEPNPSIHTLLS